jgi:hypothetical protein
LQRIPVAPVESPAAGRHPGAALLEAEAVGGGHDGTDAIQRIGIERLQVGRTAIRTAEQAAVTEFAGPGEPGIQAVGQRLRQSETPFLCAAVQTLLAVVGDVGQARIERIAGGIGLEAKPRCAPDG